MTTGNHRNTKPVSCPRCGKSMRFRRRDETRFWECEDASRLGSDRCLGKIAIPGDERLAIVTIAHDMARLQKFGSSSVDRRNEQSANRRAASNCLKAAENRYLADFEREALRRAAAVLDRLASAAEKAKNALKLAEEQRRQELEARALREQLALAAEFFADLTDAEKRFQAEAFAEYINRTMRCELVSIGWDLRNIDRVLAGEITGDLAADAWQSLSLKIGYAIRYDLKDHFNITTPEDFAKFKEAYHAEKDRAAAVEAAENVVSLKSEA